MPLTVRATILLSVERRRIWRMAPKQRGKLKESIGTCALSQDYLREVKRLAETALIQAKAVTPCEHHEGVLLHNGDDGAENVAYNLASIWLLDEVGKFMRADLQDAIMSVLDRAAKDGCPECARLKDS